MHWFDPKLWQPTVEWQLSTLQKHGLDGLVTLKVQIYLNHEINK